MENIDILLWVVKGGFFLVLGVIWFGLDKKIKKLNQRLDLIDQKISELDSRMAEAEQKLWRLEGGLSEEDINAINGVASAPKKSDGSKIHSINSN